MIGDTGEGPGRRVTLCPVLPCGFLSRPTDRRSLSELLLPGHGGKCTGFADSVTHLAMYGMDGNL